MVESVSSQKRSISVQSELSSGNDEQDFKRTRIDSSLISGIGTSEVDLSSLASNDDLEQSVTPQPGQILTSNNSSSLQLPDLIPNSQPAVINSNVEATQDDLQKPQAPADPDKLADALLSSGVDLKAEEALLAQGQLELPSTISSSHLYSNRSMIQLDPFLDQRNLETFINRIILANKLRTITANMEEEKQILELITCACEEWMKNILTSTTVISRHRRRATNKLNKKRSEISKALRDLALKDKAQEDSRIERKKQLGLSNDDTEKEGSEEIQHKATNATVAMMTGGKKKKKYSWMTGGSGAGAGASSKSGGSSGANDQTIRYREAREEQGIAVRDLLSSLEKVRMGVDKTLVKGYAKSKD